MFEQFPKTRPPLPKELAAIYESHYKANRHGSTPATSVAARMERWLHRRVAEDVASSPRPLATLEVGAGTLNQLEYEPQSFPYDIIEPFTALFADSPHLDRIRAIYADISDVPRERRYDRITSVATFEHVCDLPCVVSRAGLLLNPGGTLRVGIPSEGTPLWTLAWKLGTGVEFRMKHGVDYSLMMKYEHVNTAREIEDVLRYCFGVVRVRTFGLSRWLSLYQFFECRNADVSRCEAVAASALCAPRGA